MDTINPADVFGPRRVKHILMKDNGFDICWVWVGNMYAELRRLAWRYIEIDSPMHMYFDVICETDQCVHPDHIYATCTPVGRMMHVRDNSVPRGDCRVWTGTIREGVPTMRGLGGDSHTSVRRFVYEQEHGMETVRGMKVFPSCGNKLCVSHRHLKPTFTDCSEGSHG